MDLPGLEIQHMVSIIEIEHLDQLGLVQTHQEYLKE